MEKIHELAGAVFCSDTASLDPATGGTHRYGLVTIPQGEADSISGPRTIAWLSFQQGNPADVGRNGFFNEEALVAVQHRLKGFQNGPFKCPENEVAIEFIQKALDALDARTARITAPTAPE